MRTPLSLLFAFVAALGACGSPGTATHVNFPSPLLEGPERGQLQLVFNRKVEQLSLSLNGVLVADGLSARRLTIRNVDSGYADLVVAGDGVEKATRVWIEAGKTTALPLAAVPVPKAMNPLLATALSIVALMVTQSAQEYLF